MSDMFEMHPMFTQSSLYRYYVQVRECATPSAGMLEKFDNWLYNELQYDRATQPEMLLSHLFEVYRLEYAAYVLRTGEADFEAMMARMMGQIRQKATYVII